ncbi:MAG: ROK family transcriptional regulator [Acidimicrobiales bacterium]
MITPPDPRDAQSLSTHNRSLILNALRDEPLSRAQLGRITGLSAPSVTRLTKGLIDERMVVELDEQTGGLGRPARLLARNPGAGALAAFEPLSPTTGHWALANAVGTLVAEGEFHTDPNGPADEDALVEQAAACIHRASETTRLELLALAVAVPGMVNPNTGHVYEAPNLGWFDVGLARLLEKHFHPDVRVAVDNDVRVQAYAHRRRTLDPAVRDFVVVRLDTGLGSAIVVNDTLVRGHHWAAGEVGFLPLGTDRPCGQLPGGRGVLEQQLSAEGIVQRYRNALCEQSQAPYNENIDAVDIVRRAGHDPVAQKVVNDTITLLGLGTAAITSIVDPQVIIVDGIIGTRINGLGEALTAELERVFLNPPEVLISALGAEGAVPGALELAELLTLGAVAGPLHPTSMAVVRP